MIWPLKNFKPEELLSPDGLEQLERSNLMLDLKAMQMVDEFRDFVGHPILCNFDNLKLRGFRSIDENRKNKLGAPYSRHTQGKAFDLTCPALNIKEFYFKAVDFGWPAIGYYFNKNFIHCDWRDLLPQEDGSIYRISWKGDITGEVVQFKEKSIIEALPNLKRIISI